MRTSIKKEFAEAKCGLEGERGNSRELGKASVMTFILLPTLPLRPRMFPSPKSRRFLAEPIGVRSWS